MEKFTVHLTIHKDIILMAADQLAAREAALAIEDQYPVVAHEEWTERHIQVIPHYVSARAVQHYITDYQALCDVCQTKPATIVVNSRNGGYSIGVCSQACADNEPTIEEEFDDCCFDDDDFDDDFDDFDEFDDDDEFYDEDW